MLVVWCLAWMSAFMDPMGLHALRHEAVSDRMAVMQRGPANAALDRLRDALGQG